MNLLRQRAWRRISHIFPERQIYIRSDGRVQFFTFDSKMQAILAAVCVLFLGWVAFTSVNVIFKDRILAAKEHHFQQMQASYESRIADLQLSYDELNSQLVLAQDRFQAVADSFQAKQQTLAAIIEHKTALQASLGIGAGTAPSVTTASPKQTGRAKPGVGGVFDPLDSNAPAIVPPLALPGSQTQDSTVSAPPAKPEPSDGSMHGPDKTTFLRGAVLKLGSLFHRKVSRNESTGPLMQQANAQSARIVRLDVGQSTLLAEATQDVSKEATRLSRALQATGVNSASLLKRIAEEQGPEKPLITAASTTEITDDAFGAGIGDAAIAMGKLRDVVAALKSVPLISPTEVGSVSSGFGARPDPFNEQLAFHTGIDFSGPKGSDVRATAPGVVVFAGKNGDYGNTVEIDHGYGMRTRYGHLSKILAPLGSRVDTGTVVGKLGSTGRSTGPHVHYEVWYGDSVRDPGRFIKAGQDVLKN